MQRRRSYTTNRRGHSVAALVIFAVLSMNIACHSDGPKRTVIAANEAWTVAAIGPVDEADVQVGFEVTRQGAPYAAGIFITTVIHFTRSIPDATGSHPTFSDSGTNQL